MTAQQAPASAEHVEHAPAADCEDVALVTAALRQTAGARGLSSIAAIPGGLTNRIYRVVPSQGPAFVARISSRQSALLSIDRHAECHNSRAAAQAGVGPRVAYCDPSAGVALVEWIDARTFTPRDLDDTRTLQRVADMCRRLHAGPRFATGFDMFEVQRTYLDIVLSNGFRLPARYREFEPVVERIRRALGVHPLHTVPCHNDLLAANILDDGERLWFIDYEYAGNNDPCFELGNVWSEASLAPDRLDALVTAYFGRYSTSLIARARLLALMSKYGWTLWASIQDAVSGVDFDFWQWGMEKYDRAVAEFDSPGIERLIEDVTQPH